MDAVDELPAADRLPVGFEHPDPGARDAQAVDDSLERDAFALLEGTIVDRRARRHVEKKRFESRREHEAPEGHDGVTSFEEEVAHELEA